VSDQKNTLQESSQLKLLLYRLTRAEIATESNITGSGQMSLLNPHLETLVKIKKSDSIIEVNMLFSTQVNQSDGNKLFSLAAEYMGRFAYDSSLQDENVLKFAKLNAPSIIFPFLRAAIASLTLSAGYPPLNLPVINFTKQEVKVEAE